MKPSIYRISLDVHDAHSGVCLDMKRKDTARQINITLTDAGFPYQISEECYAVFSATKADGKRLLHHCEIRNNTIHYAVRPQTTAAVGLCECEIRLYGANDKLLFSPGFSIQISENAMDEEDDLISEDEVDELTHLISEASRVIAEAQDSNETTESLIEDLEKSKKNLTAMVLSAQNYSNKAQSSYERAEAAASFAQNYANVALDSANNAEHAADRAELAAKRAEENGTGNGNLTVPGAVSMISFIDDDCREATFLDLFPAICQAGIPYALACSPGNIGVTEGYMRVDQLQTMYESGVGISCHHWTQTNMNRYESAEAYAEDLDKCLAKFEEWGIRDVSSVCYPQGVYDDAFMKPVRERFKLGFGTFRGINNVPLESYYLRRCELFPQDGSFTIQQAKDMVDRVAAEGGWLIFMTHAWYTTFSKGELLDLISYIKDKKVHIGSIDDGLNTFGNQAEAGAFHRPIESNAEPYFVKDASGQVWSKEYGAAELTLRTAKVISNTGPVVSVSSGDTEYVVSEKLDITGQDTVILSGWASDGNGLYVMYDADGNRKQVRYSAVSYADGGEYMNNLVVPVPDGVTHIAAAGYFRKQMPGVIVQQSCTVTDEQIEQAVVGYLQENPIGSGVTIYDDGNGNVSIRSKNPRALTFSSRATGENPVFYRGYIQAVTKAEFTSTAVGALQEE